MIERDNSASMGIAAVRRAVPAHQHRFFRVKGSNLISVSRIKLPYPRLSNVLIAAGKSSGIRRMFLVLAGDWLHSSETARTIDKRASGQFEARYVLFPPLCKMTKGGVSSARICN